MEKYLNKFIVWNCEKLIFSTVGDPMQPIPEFSITKAVDIDIVEQKLYLSSTTYMYLLVTDIEGHFNSRTEAESYVESIKATTKSSGFTVSSYPTIDVAGHSPTMYTGGTDSISYPYGIGDNVRFIYEEDSYYYKVGARGLEHHNGDDDQILYDMNIPSMSHFCERAYGYTPDSRQPDCLPPYRLNDLNAANRLIIEIREEIARQHKEAEEPCKIEKEIEEIIRVQEESKKTESYTPIYNFGDIVSFQFEDRILPYKVCTYYMTSQVHDWNYIYKLLGVDPKSFIEEVTGKPAEKIVSVYGTKDNESRDKLILALKRECEKHSYMRETPPIESPTPKVSVPTLSQKSSRIDVSLDGLEVERLTIH